MTGQPPLSAQNFGRRVASPPASPATLRGRRRVRRRRWRLRARLPPASPVRRDLEERERRLPLSFDRLRTGGAGTTPATALYPAWPPAVCDHRAAVLAARLPAGRACASCAQRSERREERSLFSPDPLRTGNAARQPGRGGRTDIVGEVLSRERRLPRHRP
ncbi:hypothetical protein AXF42_Ash001700 [Apostasia shenzhenica]|uniref:Uncharacterized protein n=1 Tax=Apostasia shenzhenica TaxID=1088818 RepID=A0A2I0AAZ3_9ASPA|nr:hypothetical protein AXF42_Ash001700 [Apostasia shenzhenica]